jgi:protoporphyrinogen oxidase
VTQVAVIGAGITGLAAAWELEQAGVPSVVLESERRAGGVIVTERRDGFVVEGGPDGFLAAEPELQDLAREVGIGDRLVEQLTRGSSVVADGTLKPLGEGEAATLLGIEVQGEGTLSKGFKSFASGMADIIEALVARLAPRISTSRSVLGLARAPHGYRLVFSGGSTLDVDGVICAVPAGIMARLVRNVGVPPAEDLEEVLYFPSLTVSLAYRREDIDAELVGTGFVARAGSTDPLRACTYASLKYPGRAPAGFLLLRAFLGSVSGHPAAVAHAELARVLSITHPPAWSRTFHWVRGLPRYKPHHAERVAVIRQQLGRLPPIAIAGAGVDRAGLSACVRSGREAALEVLRRLGK